MAKIDVKGMSITVISGGADDYISLTDIARYKDSERTDYIIQSWLRNRNTIEFLGIWEQLNNPDFNPIEFDGIRRQAGLNSFVLTTKRWTETTCAIGISSRAGRYGGTYAHKDIAFEFASWVSVEFKLYLIKEFQRLKETEYQQPDQDQLPHPHRRHQGQPDSAATDAAADQSRLRQRGGPAEHGAIRQNRETVAR